MCECLDSRDITGVSALKQKKTTLIGDFFILTVECVGRRLLAMNEKLRLNLYMCSRMFVPLLNAHVLEF